MKQPKITFWLKQNGEFNKKKPALIMLNCSYGKRMRMSAELTIIPTNWDESKYLPKTSFGDYATYKNALHNLEVKVYEGLEYFAKQGIIPDPSTLKKYVQGKKAVLKQESEVRNIESYYSEFLESKKPDLKETTYRKYKTVKLLLKEYEEKYSCKLTFENMNLEFAAKFKNYLNYVRGNNNNAASKNIDCLKVFLKWAFKKSYHKEFYYSEFKSKREKTEVVYLNLAELKLLLNLKLEEGTKLYRTRDWFCFQCLTGQRYSDIAGLKWVHLSETQDGLVWNLYQIKGNKPEKVTIPLYNLALEILERQDKCKENVFKNIYNQHLNKNVKDLCELAGINTYVHKVVYSGKQAKDKSGAKHQHITSHTARRSFVNIAYYEFGMDKETIRAITGHASDKQLNHYIGKDKKHMFEQMKKWNTI